LEFLQKKYKKEDINKKIPSYDRLYNSSNNADKFGFLRQLDEQCVHIAREREKMFLADRDAKAKQSNKNLRLPQIKRRGYTSMGSRKKKKAQLLLEKKENRRDFLMKKREIFLSKMNISNKE